MPLPRSRSCSRSGWRPGAAATTATKLRATRSSACRGSSARASTSPAATRRRARPSRTTRSAGSTGCNRFTASYTVDGDAMEIGTTATTRMACPPPADAVERAYLAALGRVAAWHLDGSELVLADAEHNELLRYEEASPVGDWEVTAFLRGDAVSSPLPGTRITASFGDDGTLTGSSGCNTYRASFTLGRGSIVIEPPASTEIACDTPEGVMEQEAAYLAALPTAVALPGRRRLAVAAQPRRGHRRLLRARARSRARARAPSRAAGGRVSRRGDRSPR